MAFMYISEYATIAVVDGQAVQCGQEPAVATQKVSFTGTAGVSAAFNAQTRFLRVHVDGIASFVIGTAPSALTTDPRMAAGATEFFGVPNTGTYKISAITNT